MCLFSEYFIYLCVYGPNLFSKDLNLSFQSSLANMLIILFLLITLTVLLVFFTFKVLLVVILFLYLLLYHRQVIFLIAH
jgi:hypothetical protein